MNKMYLLVCAMLLPLWGCAQVKNTATEVKDYREVDGKIILEMVVNGVVADFVLDLAGHNAILPEYVKKFNIDPESEGDFRYDAFLYKKVPVAGSVAISTMAFGNNVFGNSVAAFVLEDAPYLRELGVAGIVGGALFRDVVLTIDSRRRKITTSVPYRPSYMKLDHRADMNVLSGSAIALPVTLDGTELPLLFDTWNDGMVTLTPSDFARLRGDAGREAQLYNGYGKPALAGDTRTVGKCDFVKSSFDGVIVAENGELPRSVLGTGILKEGIISVDYQKQKVYFQPFDLVEVKDDMQAGTGVTVEAGELNPITRDYFLEHIYDYRKDKEFVFKGDKPVVIDFWADVVWSLHEIDPRVGEDGRKIQRSGYFPESERRQGKGIVQYVQRGSVADLIFYPRGRETDYRNGSDTGEVYTNYRREIVEEIISD